MVRQTKLFGIERKLFHRSATGSDIRELAFPRRRRSYLKHRWRKVERHHFPREGCHSETGVARSATKIQNPSRSLLVRRIVGWG